VRALAVLLSIFASSCASAPRARIAAAVDRGDLDGAYEAYEQFRSHEGTDVELLGRIAGLVLEREVQSDDDAIRGAALTQLGLAGTAGAPILVRLADARGVGPGRLGALTLLAQRGHEPSRLALRALADHEEPEVLAASVGGMDPSLDRELLFTLAASEHAEVRRAAVELLGRAAADASVAGALERVARVDPDESVRAAAVRALGGAGEHGVEILRERLGDPEPMVRFAALSALVRAAPDQARVALASLLEIAPSAAGIEAARLLCSIEDRGALVPARDYLVRALASEDPQIRSQAGIALSSLPRDREPPLEILRDALGREPDREVQLSLARALFRHERPAALRALRELVRSDAAMVRVQAAMMLAAEGDADALATLESVAASGDATILRRTAVRGLARDAMRPESARRYLLDDDALVRIYAAGGILAAAAAS
jgi:HEAT repeat protein